MRSQCWLVLAAKARPPVPVAGSTTVPLFVPYIYVLVFPFPFNQKYKIADHPHLR